MKNIFVTDLDGTFINRDESISKINRQAINDALAVGDYFCIATGRSWVEMKNIYDDLGLDIPVACSNGLHIIFGDNKDIKFLINSETVNGIIFDSPFKDDITGFFIKGLTTTIMHNVNNIFVNPHNYSHNHKILKNKNDLSLEGLEITSIAFSCKPNVSEAMIKQWLENNKLELNVNTYIGDGFNTFEVTKNITKEDAIKHLSKHYGLSIENVISFGDEWNDREMLIASGIGIAVKNAKPEIKEIANKVSDYKYNESAVGKEIQKIINKK